MHKLLIAFIALQLIVAGLFGNSLPGDSALPANNSRSIKILSWNIQMLPRVAGDKGQEMRAKAIGEVLKTTDYDLIIFQEAFTKTTRELIWNTLKATFPYESGLPIGKGVTLINSGVWMVSKLPIKQRVDKLYRECEGIDCFSKKGATLVEVDKDGKTFQIIGTHLQADSGKEKQIIRIAQYYDLVQLLDANKKDGVPQIIAGDFNTDITDTISYKNMLNILKAENGPMSGELQYTWDSSLNDITINTNNPHRVVYDYIFTRYNGFDTTEEARYIRRYKQFWNTTNADLSDHFAVEGVFKY